MAFRSDYTEPSTIGSKCQIPDYFEEIQEFLSFYLPERVSHLPWRCQLEHSSRLGLRSFVQVKYSAKDSGLQLVWHSRYKDVAIVTLLGYIAVLLVAGLCRIGVHQSQPICFSIAAFSEALVVPGWGVSADLKMTQQSV